MNSFPSKEMVWFVHPAGGPDLGVLWNGSETFVVGGPGGSHLGGHAEKGAAYRDAKLEWVRGLGYVDAGTAMKAGSLPTSWRPLTLSWRDRRVVRVLLRR